MTEAKKAAAPKAAAPAKKATAADKIAKELAAGSEKFRVKGDKPGTDIVVEVVPSFLGEVEV